MKHGQVFDGRRQIERCRSRFRILFWMNLNDRLRNDDGFDRVKLWGGRR